MGEAERREALLLGLSADFAEAEKRLDRDTVFTGLAFDAAARWLELGRLDTPPPNVAAVADTLLSEMLFVGSYEPPLGAVQALINGGDMSILQSPDLSNELTAWAALVESFRERQVNAVDVYQNQAMPFLIESGISIADLMWTDLEYDAPLAPRRTQAHRLLSDSRWENIASNVWYAAYDVRVQEGALRSALTRIQLLLERDLSES